MISEERLVEMERMYAGDAPNEAAERILKAALLELVVEVRRLRRALEFMAGPDTHSGEGGLYFKSLATKALKLAGGGEK